MFTKELMDKKITAFGVVSSVLLYIAVAPSMGTMTQPWYLQAMISIVLICIVFIRRARDLCVASRYQIASYIAKLAMLPYVLFTLWTLLLMTIGVAGYSQFTRPISTVVQYGLVLGVMVALSCEYGEKAIDRFFWVMCAAAFVSFAKGIVLTSFGTFVAYLGGADSLAKRWFELHDIGLTMPMLFIYYFEINRMASQRGIKCTLALIITLVCLKRIAIGAAVVVILVSFFVRTRTKKTGTLLSTLFEIGLILTTCLWVYVTGTDLFSQLCSQFDINPMGRAAVYAYFRNHLSFSPTFLGQGYGYTSVLLQSITNTAARIEGALNIQAIHNDVLKTYIEEGPWLFLFWVIWFALLIPKKLGSKYGQQTERASLLVFFYAFIVYFTDNTTSYFCFQCAIYLMIFCFIEGQLAVNRNNYQVERDCYGIQE